VDGENEKVLLARSQAPQENSCLTRFVRAALKAKIHFVRNEKLSRRDKLLLAFDAYTLSLALGTTPTIGKTMHGMDQRTVPFDSHHLSALFG
jgi:hypothetical protein